MESWARKNKVRSITFPVTKCITMLSYQNITGINRHKNQWSKIKCYIQSADIANELLTKVQEQTKEKNSHFNKDAEAIGCTLTKWN